MTGEAFLCDKCPGKGNPSVDFDVSGSCPRLVVDSFRQARRYKIEHPEDYSSDQELIELTVGSLDYYDEETDDMTISVGGHEGGAILGVLCANQFLVGKCEKSRDEIILESAID